MRCFIIAVAVFSWFSHTAMASHASDPPRIHSVCDISQSFTFYMDGRFAKQYLKGVAHDVRNWGSLSQLDLANVNLLVLTGGDKHIPYDAGARANITKFVRDGGGLLLMADGGDLKMPGHAIAQIFGAQFDDERAKKPAHGVDALADQEISFRGGRVLTLSRRAKWRTLIEDDNGESLLAIRSYGKGAVLLGTRGLFGQRPDASDPINANWLTPLLSELTQGKVIDPKKPHRRTWAEHARQLGPLRLEFHDGTKRYAQSIYEVYREVRPHLVAITGVEPSPGMVKTMLILPTGGGGFSSGARIAIGAWWGNYPERRYPMVELIAHEAGHSWVLPHGEPVWNEPIATYLGIQVGKRLGMDEADDVLGSQIARARRHDPELNTIDPLADDAPRDLIWGKSYFVFEELERLHGPSALAKYFKAKRELVASERAEYTMDDAVAVWSHALGTDLFEWFRSLAFSVDASQTDLFTTKNATQSQ